jgi:hypothetical protein
MYVDAGRPDWANVQLLGDSFPEAVLVNRRSSPIWSYFFPRKKFSISFDQKSHRFGAIV